jgi:hypothetical protein
MAWSPLQYVLGFAELGHDVYYLEDSDDYPSCVNPVTGLIDTDPVYGLTFADEAFNRLGMGTRWAYYDAHADKWHGPVGARMLELCRTADVLLNVAALNPLRPWMDKIPHKVMIDGESVFTQLRHLTKPADRLRAEQHTAFFTLAENYGKDGCTVPSDGFPWLTTRHPIALSAWPEMPGRPKGKFTSVLSWESVPPIEYKGLYYGMKSTAFDNYRSLPELVGPVFDLAISNCPRDFFSEDGWRIRTGLEMRSVVRDPWSYQNFIRDSKGEFCINRHGFAVTWSGWFAERSIAYLATGRPVMALDTGFSAVLPTGDGLFAFASPDAVRDAVENIESAYEYHCHKARELAVEYFDAKKVLSAMLDRLN